MNKISTEIVKGIVILTTIVSCFNLTGNLKPKYEEFETHTLTNGDKSTLDIGNATPIACYGAEGNNKEWYLNATLLTDTTDYVIHKQLEFQTNKENAKLRINAIKLDDDVCNKAICFKIWCNDDFYECRNAAEFKGHTFESFGNADVYLWFELSKITKDEIVASNGTSIDIEFSIE